MTDYFPLIARAVEGLETSTGEARRALLRTGPQRIGCAVALRGTGAAGNRHHQRTSRPRRCDPQGRSRCGAQITRGECANRVPPQPPPPRAERSMLAGKTLDAARRGETCLHRQDQPRSTGADAPPPDAPPPSARERLLGARTSSRPRESIKGFRDVVNEVHDLGAATAKSAQAARDTRESLWTGCAALLAPDRRRPQHPSRAISSRKSKRKI